MDWARALPIVVQFGIGAVLCLIGIVAGLRSGYLDLKLAEDRRMIGLIAAGYFGLLALYYVQWLLAPGIFSERQRFFCFNVGMTLYLAGVVLRFLWIDLRWLRSRNGERLSTGH